MELDPSWVIPTDHTHQAEINLICLPFSGGNALSYLPWKDRLDKRIRLIPVQLPGRGNRLRETPYTDMNTLIPDLARQLSPYTQGKFALFGHSLGALIAFELAHHLTEQNLLASHLFTSGYSAPHCPWPETRQRPRVIYNLENAAFKEQLKAFNGTPAEILEDEDMLALFLPTLRADFQLLDTYDYQQKPKLSIPLTAFGGLNDTDDMPKDQVKAWGELTEANSSFYMLPGDHFFIQSSQAILLQLIQQKLGIETADFF